MAKINKQTKRNKQKQSKKEEIFIGRRKSTPNLFSINVPRTGIVVV